MSVHGSGWGGIRRLLAPGDLDGDGHADLLGVTGSGQLVLYSGDGHGWIAGQRVVGASGWTAMSQMTGVGDSDGDGHIDLVTVVASTGVQRFYPGLGNGRFGSPRQIGTGWQATIDLVGMRDLDGDGHLDLVAREARTGRMRTYFGTGTGDFGSRLTWGAGWQHATALTGGVDVDGDGHTDVVAVIGGQLRVYAGTGQREYSAVGTTPVDLTGAISPFVLGDLDHDGTSEVLARTSAGTLMLWDDAGQAGAAAAPRKIGGSGWDTMNLVAPAGDMTMDGVPDLLARQASTGDLYLYPMTSTGGFTNRVLLATGMAGMTDILGVGPNDPGAAPDVIAREGTGGELLVFPGDGPGRLLSPHVVRTSTSAVARLVAAGDVDGDGLTDVVFRQTDGALGLWSGVSTGGYAGSRSLVVNPRVAGRELG